MWLCGFSGTLSSDHHMHNNIFKAKETLGNSSFFSIIFDGHLKTQQTMARRWRLSMLALPPGCLLDMTELRGK
jgi:hypothetical protein